LGEPLTNFNGKDFNEDEDGAVEVVDGGDGEDTLYVYGTADISKLWSIVNRTCRNSLWCYFLVVPFIEGIPGYKMVMVVALIRN